MTSGIYKYKTPDFLYNLLGSNIRVNCILTDPPYFVLPNGKKQRNGELDDFTWDDFKTLDVFKTFTKNWLEPAFQVLESDSFMFVFWSSKYLHLGLDLIRETLSVEPGKTRVIFWHYRNLTLGGNGDFSYDYEPVFVIKKGNPKLIKGKHSSCLDFTKPQSNFKNDTLVHPTQKPIALCEHLLKIVEWNVEKPLILDMFAGAGTSCLAAKNLGFDYIGADIVDEYLQMCENRGLNLI